jgi:hypothetical protein
LLDSRERFGQYSTIVLNQSNMGKKLDLIERQFWEQRGVGGDKPVETTEYLAIKLTSIELFGQDLQRLWELANFLDTSDDSMSLGGEYSQGAAANFKTVNDLQRALSAARKEHELARKNAGLTSFPLQLPKDAHDRLRQLVEQYDAKVAAIRAEYAKLSQPTLDLFDALAERARSRAQISSGIAAIAQVVVVLATLLSAALALYKKYRELETGAVAPVAPGTSGA